MNLIENLADIPAKLGDFFSDIVSAIVSVLEALNGFLGMLQEFDDKIVAMTDSCGTSEFTGMPIVDAIGTFRYLVGDIAFYMIYFCVLFGCLLTIYKLVVLLYEAIDALVSRVTGVSSKQHFTNVLSKLKFK